MKKNKSISEQGYKKNSPFKNRSKLDISTPSGIITTDQRAFPILANGVPLYPNTGDYQFNTDTVTEIPMKKVKKAQKGTIINPNQGMSDYLWGNPTLNPVSTPINPAMPKLYDRSNYNPELVNSQDLRQPTPQLNPNNLGSQFKGAMDSLTAVPLSKTKKKFDMGNAVQVAGALFNEFVPDQPNRKYLRPEQLQSYNPNAYGSGSQAIMQDGGFISPPNKKVKRKLQKEVPNNYGIYQGIIGEDGKSIDVPTEQQAVQTMINYMKNNTPDSNIYRDQFQHHSINVNPAPQPNDIPAFAKNGTKVQNYNHVGLQVYEGGSAPITSYNFVDGGMGEFKGNSHDNGGITSSYNGKPFEAEGGEPYRIDQEGSLEIFGNLYNPFTGNKFKKDAKLISKQEKKAQKYLDKGTNIVNNTEPVGKYDKLAFNSGRAMLEGGLSKQKQLAQEKNKLSSIQQMLLDSQDNTMEYGGIMKFQNGGLMKYAEGGDPIKEVREQKELFQKMLKNPKGYYPYELEQAKEFLKNPSSFYKGLVDYQKNAIKGGAKDSFWKEDLNNYNEVLDYLKNPKKYETKITTDNTKNISLKPTPSNSQGPKPWDYGKANVANLDTKLKTLVSMLQAKGFEGSTPEKGGYDKRNTKSGHPSRHASNQALDAILSNPDAYNAILKDKEISSYIYDNGLTAINEYDPKVQNLTQKNPVKLPHIHFGYDKGTPTSDKFRRDYEATYKPSKKATTVNPLVKGAYANAPIGDNPIPPIDKWTFQNRLTKQPSVEPKTYDSLAPRASNFTNPPKKDFVAPKRNRPWEQIAPVIPQLFDQVDPVLMQQYTPDLLNPYSVSFQDRRNQNEAQLAGIRKIASDTPSALGTLGAQAYNANDGVNAEEFRTNQGIFNDITNRNVATLNDAKLKNLSLTDQQYGRQTQATANTRDRRTAAGIQLGDILAKNNLENKTLDVTSQLYRNYAYDKDMQLQYVGGPQSIGTSELNTPAKSVVQTTQGNTKTTDTYLPNQFKMAPIHLLDGMKKDWQKKFKGENGGKVTLSNISKLMYNQ